MGDDDEVDEPVARQIPLWPDNPTAEDLLGFEDIAAPVLDAVGRDKLDPVAVGVFGDWGSGKTTILEILRGKLSPSDDVLVVFTRPWEYDPQLDPKGTLIAEVLEKLGEKIQADKSRWAQVKDKFGGLAKRVNWSKAIALAAKGAVTFPIASASDLADIFSGPEEAPDPTLAGFRDDFAELMKELTEIRRVVVLVDDLDRCLPETVVATLEAIKLFLSVEKMAFVLAADRRSVELAIAERFGSAPQPAHMAREYLEKIIQIPVAVPSLDQGDTEAYLAMMLLEHHLDQEGGVLGEIVSRCDLRRRAAEARIFEGLEDLIPPAARDDVALAGYLAPVLNERLGGNPRRLKRFLNAFWLRSAIADRRAASLEPTALAKLMVLEQLEPDAFDQLLGWLGDGTLTDKLRTLEDDKKVPDNGHAAFEWWLSLAPGLKDVPLGPYLRLAATLRRRVGLDSDLRADLREILDALHTGANQSKTRARTKLLGLPEPDRAILVKEILEVMRVEPGAQEDLARAVGELIKDAAHVEALLEGLRRLDPPRIDVAVVIALHEAPRDTVRPVVREWIDTGRLNEVARNAAEELLEGEG